MLADHTLRPDHGSLSNFVGSKPQFHVDDSGNVYLQERWDRIVGAACSPAAAHKAATRSPPSHQPQPQDHTSCSALAPAAPFLISPRLCAARKEEVRRQKQQKKQAKANGLRHAGQRLRSAPPSAPASGIGGVGTAVLVLLVVLALTLFASNGFDVNAVGQQIGSLFSS